MVEMSYDFMVDGGNGKLARVKALDDQLIWPRPARHPHRDLPAWWKPDLERQLVDLHARYERACVED